MGLARGPGWPGTGKGDRVCDEGGKSGRERGRDSANRSQSGPDARPTLLHTHRCAIHARHTDKPTHPGAATFADACVLIEVVAKGALALEAPKSVDAVATLAEARQLLALIDI